LTRNKLHINNIKTRLLCPGKLIQTKNLETNEGSLYINEQNLRNGVYFYTILVGEKNIKTDKVVIIK